MFFYEFPYHLFNLSSSHLISLSASEHSSLELVFISDLMDISSLNFITNVNKSTLSCFNSYDVAQEKHFMSQFSKYRWENGLFTKNVVQEETCTTYCADRLAINSSLEICGSASTSDHARFIFLCFFLSEALYVIMHYQKIIFFINLSSVYLRRKVKCSSTNN